MTTVWQELDVSKLSIKAQKAYQDYRTAQGLAKSARLSFEAVVKSDFSAPDGRELAFGYKFGKLAVTLVDAKAAPNGKGKVSLAEYLSGRQSSGLAT